jgi:hypothetical protein
MEMKSKRRKVMKKRIKYFVIVIVLAIIGAPAPARADPPLKLVVVDGEHPEYGEPLDFSGIDVRGKFLYEDGPAPAHAYVVALCTVIRVSTGDLCIYDVAHSPSRWVNAEGGFAIYDAPIREYAVVHVVFPEGWPAPVLPLDAETGEPIRFLSLNDVDLGTVHLADTWHNAYCKLMGCPLRYEVNLMTWLYLPIVMRESSGDILTAANYDFPIMYGDDQ